MQVPLLTGSERRYMSRALKITAVGKIVGQAKIFVISRQG
jgi:hypothetical protein